MKFTSEVVAALKTLRNAAENDFERHRLDVLERDLTAPPTVEVIDDTHQKFNGVTFFMDTYGHYKTNLPLHRAVWSYYHGYIPAGNYEIHHIDINKANNDISNLQLLTKSQHHYLHKAERIKKACPICGKIFYVLPFRKNQLYCSRDCARLGFHQSQQVDYVKKICPVCQKTFFVPPSQNKQVHCSRKCASKTVSIKQKHLTMEKICPVCQKPFSVPDYLSKQVCCSLSCAQKLIWKNREKPNRVRTCVFCKKEFSVPYTTNKKKYCSAQCYHESRRKK